MESDYECMICLNLLIFPVTFPCNHDMCLSCFKKICYTKLKTASADKSVTCPTCQKDIKEWLEKGSRNGIMSLVDTVKWEVISSLFPAKVKKCMKLKDNGLTIVHDVLSDDETSDNANLLVSEEGSLRKEYEEMLKKEQEEAAQRKLEEERESAALLDQFRLEDEQARGWLYQGVFPPSTYQPPVNHLNTGSVHQVPFSHYNQVPPLTQPIPPLTQPIPPLTQPIPPFTQQIPPLTQQMPQWTQQIPAARQIPSWQPANQQVQLSREVLGRALTAALSEEPSVSMPRREQTISAPVLPMSNDNFSLFPSGFLLPPAQSINTRPPLTGSQTLTLADSVRAGFSSYSPLLAQPNFPPTLSPTKNDVTKTIVPEQSVRHQLVRSSETLLQPVSQQNIQSLDAKHPAKATRKAGKDHKKNEDFKPYSRVSHQSASGLNTEYKQNISKSNEDHKQNLSFDELSNYIQQSGNLWPGQDIYHSAGSVYNSSETHNQVQPIAVPPFKDFSWGNYCDSDQRNNDHNIGHYSSNDNRLGHFQSSSQSDSCVKALDGQYPQCLNQLELLDKQYQNRHTFSDQFEFSSPNDMPALDKQVQNKQQHYHSKIKLKKQFINSHQQLNDFSTLDMHNRLNNNLVGQDHQNRYKQFNSVLDKPNQSGHQNYKDELPFNQQFQSFRQEPDDKLAIDTSYQNKHQLELNRYHQSMQTSVHHQPDDEFALDMSHRSSCQPNNNQLALDMSHRSSHQLTNNQLALDMSHQSSHQLTNNQLELDMSHRSSHQLTNNQLALDMSHRSSHQPFNQLTLGKGHQSKQNEVYYQPSDQLALDMSYRNRHQPPNNQLVLNKYYQGKEHVVVYHQPDDELILDKSYQNSHQLDDQLVMGKQPLWQQDTFPEHHGNHGPSN